MSGTKSDLLVCVSELVPHHDTVKPYEAHMVILDLDGAAVVNMIKPRTPVSFDGYVTQVMPYANSSVVTCSEWIWCLMRTGRIA